MALFNKQLLKAVVLIERKNEDNKYQPNATGVMVGFLINSDEPESIKRKYRVFLLTNRHVFSEEEQLWIRFDKKDGSAVARFPILLKDEKEVKWLAHENPNVDLAMVPISPTFLDDNEIDWGFLNEEIFAYADKFSEVGIELGDGIFLAGFPLGIAGNLRNYAIVRGGIIARIDTEIMSATNCFLIDASVFPGNSGGPVFLKPELTSLDGTKAVSSVYLIGLISGYFPYQEMLYSHQSNPPKIAGVSVENSGLATVVPMDFAKEIYLNFIKQQKTLEKEVIGKNKVIDTKFSTTQTSKK